MKILITGGAGFIGSALIRFLIAETDHAVINVDKITYSGNLNSLKEISHSSRYFFEKINICHLSDLKNIFAKYNPDGVIHLAAESHVDRSIIGPEVFIQTNIIGTYNVLETSREYWMNLDEKRKREFCFHHVSTDEVYGDLSSDSEAFNEKDPYAPSSPYSATKASSNHLVSAWNKTFNLPTSITNCSNNYGPYQFPEKLIPLVISNALAGKKIPIYGNGEQIRDWLYVDDHVLGIYKVFSEGKRGETYNIGSSNQLKNNNVVSMICSFLDEAQPNSFGLKSYSELIDYVADRPAHDKRYAIDASKIKRELGWKPRYSFKQGLEKTIEWYLHERVKN